MIRALVAALVCVFAAGTAARAQEPGAEPPRDRRALEALLAKASPDNLATDFAGAWDNVYRYLLPARALDRGLFERTLIAITEGAEGCGERRGRAARLSCAAGSAASVAASLTLFEAAVELRGEAVAYAEQVVGTDPEPLVEALLALAADEQAYGSPAGIERALARVDGLAAGKPALLDAGRRFRRAILRAQLADGRLDDRAALSAVTEAIDIAEASKSGAFSATETSQPGGKPLTDLVARHLRGQFCSSCGKPVAPPIRHWIDRVLSGGADQKPGEGQPQSEFLLLALSAPEGAFGPAQLKAYAKRYLKLYGQQGPDFKADLKRLPPRLDEIASARRMALAATASGGGDVPTALALLRETDRQRQGTQAKQMLTTMAENFYDQFGADSALVVDLAEIAQNLAAAGLAPQARLTLEFLMGRDAETAPAATRLTRSGLAGTYVPALARLAALQGGDGDTVAALASLDEAGGVAAAKLAREWRFGGAGAILALRDLAPALRLAAQTRSEIVTVRGPSESGPGNDGRGHDALFRALQVAVFGETALTVEIAAQRRVLRDEGLRALRDRYLLATAEAERRARLAQLYAETKGDVDGALAKEAALAGRRRDTLAREVGTRSPNALTAAADIDPVPLTEASARLSEGEALVLLHVGPRAVHGFLLDAGGRSYAWRSAAGLARIEALVRSLRAGGDITSNAFPPFPFADAAALHEAIFGPVKDRLGRYRKLVVVGDGPLQAMPYSLLLARALDAPPSSPEALRAASPAWLVRSHAIALLPSVRSLMAQRSGQSASRAKQPFLGIGNPRFAEGSGGLRNVDITGAFTTSGEGFADVLMLRRLVSLPETEDELRAISGLLKAPFGDLVLGERASERVVRAMPLSDYRVVAFATHGALAGEVTGTSEPGLVLTPPERASREDDGFLALSEISDLRFDADLVMLSACNTASSDGRPRAEGLSGLARGFFTAGARGLLVTHWAIPSDSSVKITTGMIGTRAARPELDWADALRDSTLAVIDRVGPAEWSHPAYWGGFAVVGVMPAGGTPTARR